MDKRKKGNKEAVQCVKGGARYSYVAVDFDGTLCTDEFPEIGMPKEKCIAYVKRLAAEGSKLILHTCRENGTRKLLDEAVEFCEQQGISLFAVNENPDNEYPVQFGLRHDQGRKVYADLYIDDKAVNSEDLETFDIEALAQTDDVKLPEGGRSADAHWTEIIRLAETYGFILSAYGGAAVLATNRNQLEHTGLQAYIRTQRMNGRCPKRIGLQGCIDSMTGVFYCSKERCEIYAKNKL